jgi:hypothetical protein
MIPLDTVDPCARIDFWLDAPAKSADEVGYLRGERGRLLRTVLRRWSRLTGLQRSDAFVVQFAPEVFAVHGEPTVRVRYSFAVGPDLSRVGAKLGKTEQTRMPNPKERTRPLTAKIKKATFAR